MHPITPRTPFFIIFVPTQLLTRSERPFALGAVMITDLTRYRKYVDKFDLTEEQKLELVNSVWVILENYFDQKLGINQLAIKEKEPLKTIDSQVPPAILDKAPQEIDL